MIVLILLLIAGLVSFAASFESDSRTAAWLVGASFVPGFVLFVSILMPHQAGGVSFSALALAYSALFGATASAFAVGLAVLVRFNQRDDPCWRVGRCVTKITNHPVTQ